MHSCSALLFVLANSAKQQGLLELQIRACPLSDIAFDSAVTTMKASTISTNSNTHLYGKA